MNIYQISFISVLCGLGISACSRTSTPLTGNLPQEWIVTQKNKARTLKLTSNSHEETGPDFFEWKNPSPEADEKIRSVFTLQSAGLDRLVQMETIRKSLFQPLHGGPGGEPGEAPWHLSNFVAEFGVTVQGIFGNLMSDGGFAVKGIWRKKGQSLKKIESNPSYKVQWDTHQSRNQQLEPVIQSILRTGLVKKEDSFRKNIDRASGRFEKIVRVLEANPPIPSGWEVSRFALILSIDASGMVSPAVSVGSELLVRFDWDRPREITQKKPYPATFDLSDQDQNFLKVIRALGAQMGSTEQELNELQGQGINLEHFHVGLAVSASGTIGLVSLGGSVDGMLYYSRPGQIETIQLQSTHSDYFALNTNIPVIPSQLQKETDVLLIQPDSFRKGIKRAIKMGSYFARMGIASNSSDWSLDEIETEFEVALSGSIGVVTVESEPHLALEFHLEGDEK